MKPWMVAVGVLAVCLLPSARHVLTCDTSASEAARRSIEALDRRTREQHENMLADTQALADEIASLASQNAERAAEIVALKAEAAALRAEIEARRSARR